MAKRGDSLRNMPVDDHMVYGRQGGIVSGKVRQDRILDRYMHIVRSQGAYEALLVCMRERYHAGYKARVRWEAKNGYGPPAAERQGSPTSTNQQPVRSGIAAELDLQNYHG